MPGRIGRQGRLGRRLIAAIATGILLAGLPGVAAGADPDPATERAAHMRAIVEKMRATDDAHPDGSTHQHNGGMAALSADDLRFLGLRPGKGVCAGMYEIADAAVGHSCTHGFDPMAPIAAPANATTGDAPAAATPGAIALAATCDPIYDPDSCPKPSGWKVPTQIPCYSSGPYVEVLYVYAGTSQFAAYKERIRRSVAWADLMYQVSAAAVKDPAGTPGNRHVRWAMATGCKLKITPAQVPLAALGDLGATKASLIAQGKVVSTTKYIAYIDTGGGCDGGIAEVNDDSRPGSTNPSNYGGSFGMLDVGCTGSSDFGSIIAAHELTHTLGAVQRDAPHATNAGHCWDDIDIPGYGADIMCYDDFSVPSSKFYQRCPLTVPETFDCGKDDYFNPYPRSGNYLYDHWNSATNRFLATSEPSTWDTIPVLSVALVGNGSKIGGSASIAAIVTAPSGLTVDHVSFRVAGIDMGQDGDAPYAVDLETFAIPNLATLKVEATGYDQYGMPSRTSTATYTVANPQVHLDGPAPLVVSSPKTGWSVTASAAGGRSVSKVDLLVFDQVVATDATKPYGGLVNLAPITGYGGGLAYVELVARVTDSAGVARTTPPRGIWIGAPSGSVAPLDNYYVNAGIPTRLAAIVTPALGVGIAKVEFLVNQTLVGTDTTAPFGADWTPGSAGSRDLRIRVTDQAGYVWDGPTQPISVGSSTAVVTIVAPTDGQVVDGGSLTVNGTAVPPLPGGTVDIMWAVVDGSEYFIDPQVGSVDVPVGSWEPGYHLVRIGAVGTSSGGSWAVGSGYRQFRVDGPDVGISAPPASATVRQTVTVGATVGDLAGATVYSVDFYGGENWIGSDDTAPYSVSWNTLDEPDGVARLTARATTSVGYVVSPIRSVTKRNLRAWFTSPLPNAVVSGLVAFKAGGKCDVDCVLENATIRIDGVAVKYDNTAPYWFTWDSTKVADGPHTYSVTFSTSDARAVSTTNFPFVVDNTP